MPINLDEYMEYTIRGIDKNRRLVTAKPEGGTVSMCADPYEITVIVTMKKWYYDPEVNQPADEIKFNIFCNGEMIGGFYPIKFRYAEYYSGTRTKSVQVKIPRKFIGQTVELKVTGNFYRYWSGGGVAYTTRTTKSCKIHVIDCGRRSVPGGESPVRYVWVEAGFWVVVPKVEAGRKTVTAIKNGPLAFNILVTGVSPSDCDAKLAILDPDNKIIWSAWARSILGSSRILRFYATKEGLYKLKIIDIKGCTHGFLHGSAHYSYYVELIDPIKINVQIEAPQSAKPYSKISIRVKYDSSTYENYCKIYGGKLEPPDVPITLYDSGDLSKYRISILANDEVICGFNASRSFDKNVPFIMPNKPVTISYKVTGPDHPIFALGKFEVCKIELEKGEIEKPKPPERPPKKPTPPPERPPEERPPERPPEERPPKKPPEKKPPEKPPKEKPIEKPKPPEERPPNPKIPEGIYVFPYRGRIVMINNTWTENKVNVVDKLLFIPIGGGEGVVKAGEAVILAYKHILSVIEVYSQHSFTVLNEKGQVVARNVKYWKFVNMI